MLVCGTVGLLACWTVELLDNRTVGLLVCWTVGMFCWIDRLLTSWIVGLWDCWTAGYCWVGLLV
jgi:hypothetical protein